MILVNRKIATYLLLLTFLASFEVPAQQSTSPQSAARPLQDAAAQVLVGSGDLLRFAYHLQRDPSEYRIASELAEITREAYDYLGTVLDLLRIYNSITCRGDRATIKDFIQSRMKYYTELLELKVKDIDINLAYTANPGIAASATLTKDKIRSGIVCITRIKL